MMPFATTGDVAGADAPREGRRAFRLRWPPWLAKPVAVTVGLTLLTAWLFPALTHQWQDRQKAREVTAALVSQIGKNTSHALVTSSFITNDRFRSSADPSQFGFNQELFNELDLQFRTSSAEIDAQLQAYFPPHVVREWRAYSDLVWRTYRLITENTSTRAQTVAQLRREFPQLRPADLRAIATPWWNKPKQSASGARNAYFRVSTAVQKRREVVVDSMLDSHLAGFSTRPRDLASDLLPFF